MVFGEAAGAGNIPSGSRKPDNDAKSRPGPVLSWRGVPGIALLLAPHVSMRICSSLAPRTARHGAATISGKYLCQSL